MWIPIAFYISISQLFFSCSTTKIVTPLFRITVNERDGFIDSTGKVIIKPKYETLHKSIGEGLIAFSENKKWGYIDLNENVVIKPTFTECGVFSNGLALAVDENKKVGFIDKSGSWQIEPIYDWATGFNKDLAIAQIVFKDQKDELLYDLNAELVGVINVNGKEVIPFKYNYAEFDAPGFTEDLIVLSEQGLSTVFDRAGKKLFYKSYHIGKYFDGKALCYDMDSNRYFFIDKLGVEVGNFTGSFKSIGAFSEGFAAAKSNYGSWGYIDTTGQFIIPPQFDMVGKFSGGLAKIKIGDKYGFVNKVGEKVIPTVYDDASDYDEGLAFVKLGQRVGYINRQNKWVWEQNQTAKN
jgi:hypothetical protein